jgi:hypothetical protein
MSLVVARIEGAQVAIVSDIRWLLMIVSASDKRADTVYRSLIRVDDKAGVEIYVHANTFPKPQTAMS